MENMPVNIQLWVLNQRKQAEFACAKARKERIEYLKASYFDLLMARRETEQTKRLVNCFMPIIIEKE